ncbi:MAG: AraC family transcriptional regulator [Hymenobacteraceae bacterium]|nr:AraC family transcriptional regulator [Hymenobacteraceae bacterium]MDX5396430.1 AraC family transcriptional regulator [Hymenobacteraceae bacterium]MDX5512491.1 AraC family transcriptional regulator [Hymenobacteraceae bacterium]
MSDPEKVYPVLFIKHMVCPRCIRVVQDEFARLKIPFQQVLLGQVELNRALTDTELEGIKTALDDHGFELLETNREKLAEQIKIAVIELIRNQKETRYLKFSELLAQAVQKDYNYLSTVFSAVENCTLEKYIILQKIEYVKELISYNEMNLSEIATLLSYSSISHLSRQFKSVTGVSPSAYRKTKFTDRKPLNSINH